MRSDREEIPGGFSKADADKAETMEARLRETATIAAAPGCMVYWPAPYEICGAIRIKYDELGGPNSFLLFPKTNELINPDGYGRRTEFLGDHIYWSSATNAHPVAHDFLTKWGDYGYEGGFMKYPTIDEIINPDGIGRRQEFQGAHIYWSPGTRTLDMAGSPIPETAGQPCLTAPSASPKHSIIDGAYPWIVGIAPLDRHHNTRR